MYSKLCIKLILVLLLVSCATHAKYEAKLNSWIGADADELVDSWGAPASVYEKQNGEKILRYDYSSSGAIPITNYQTGNTSYMPVSRSCTTEFIIGNNNRVITWSYKGDACKSAD